MIPILSLALPSDSQLPITISSASAQFNQRTNTLTYQGKVDAKQGSTQLNAEQVVVRCNHENKIDKMQAVGHPALFSTMTSPDKPRLFASANTIEFNPLQSTVQLLENGQVTQGGNIMKAPHIAIDIAKEIVESKPTAKGKTTIVLEPVANLANHGKS